MQLPGLTDSSGDEVPRHQRENSIDSSLHDSDAEYDEDDKDLATLLVTPACQLRNQIRNLIKHTRTVLQDEWSEHGCFRYPSDSTETFCLSLIFLFLDNINNGSRM